MKTKYSQIDNLITSVERADDPSTFQQHLDGINSLPRTLHRVALSIPLRIALNNNNGVLSDQLYAAMKENSLASISLFNFLEAHFASCGDKERFATVLSDHKLRSVRIYPLSFIS